MTVRTRKFSFKSKEYEVRAALAESLWSIAIFQDGKRLSSISTLKDEVREDAARAGHDIVSDAMTIAQGEFEKGNTFEIEIRDRNKETGVS